MYIPKRYGESKIAKCPFCDKQSVTTNSQGFPVCVKHKDAVMNDLKCVCGSTLEVKTGKYGIFFTCITCGAMNARKVMELNEIKDISSVKEVPERNFNVQKRTGAITKKPFRPKEITITSDDPDYF